MYFTKSWIRTRFNLVKLIGISAATAMTIRLIYTELPHVAKADSSSISQSLTGKDSLVNNEKLVSVILVTRHGAYFIYKIIISELFLTDSNRCTYSFAYFGLKI
jgi:hypothetical protein